MVNAKKSKPIEPELLQTPASASKHSDYQTESRATPVLGDAKKLGVIKLTSSDSEAGLAA
jgi:hypothetical protein